MENSSLRSNPMGVGGPPGVTILNDEVYDPLRNQSYLNHKL